MRLLVGLKRDGNQERKSQERNPFSSCYLVPRERVRISWQVLARECDSCLRSWLNKLGLRLRGVFYGTYARNDPYQEQKNKRRKTDRIT